MELDCPRCGSVFATADATVMDEQEASRSYAASEELWDRLLPTGGPGRQPLPDIPGYEVLAFVARGGNGVVLKARHKALGRLVAIKMLLPRNLASPAARERFLREARSAARLRHANICPIHEVGQCEGRPYIAMDYIQGLTLRTWARTSRPSARVAADMVAKLARAVGYAHEHGVIHRDIKPDNVMVEAERSQPVLTDFGLAKEMTDPDGGVTRAGTVVGTPAYMAPEQAAGRPDKVGPATDVYALGAILYEFLCGRPPFLGSAGEILRKVQTDEPVQPRKIAPRIHRDLETICLKALAKRRERRYASAVELAEDLERFSAGEAILARREPLARKVVRLVRRNPVAAAAVAAVVLAVVGGGVSVRQALRIGRVASINQAFETGLDQADWTRGHLEQMETLLADLDRLSPGRSAEARGRLYRRLEEHLREQIRRPTLSKEDFSRLGALADLLASRSGPAARGVRQALAERQHGWLAVFDVKAPFTNLGSVIDAKHVRPEGAELACTVADPEPGRPNVLTRLACESNAQLEAVFHTSWREAHEIGVVLNTTQNGGYVFLVTTVRSAKAPADGPAPPGVSFAEAAKADGLAALRVLRNGVVLRQGMLPAAELGTGPLRLTATRQGDRLSFQAGQSAPIVFRDIFPLRGAKPGVFALCWPRAARLTRLRGRRQRLPGQPSALEHGDDLYARGRVAEALEQYRSQAVTATDEAFRQEARYKEAVCLAELKRDEEAAEVFERVAAGAGPVWPPRAGCQLWLSHLRAKRSAEAETVFQSLAARYQFERLATLVPETDRKSILTSYLGKGAGLRLMVHTPGQIRDLERGVAVSRLLGQGYSRFETWTQTWTMLALFRAYWAAGQTDQALELAEEGIRDTYEWKNQFCEEYAWLLRVLGRHDDARRMIERFLRKKDGTYDRSGIHLLTERARLHAARGDWDRAEQDVDEYFRQSSPRDNNWYLSQSSACLVKGFLRERLGDRAGAVEVWRKGFLGDPGGLAKRLKLSAMIGSGVRLLHFFVLGSLSGELSRADAERAVTMLAAKQPANSPMGILRVVRLPDSAYEALRTMCRSDRGRQIARQVAFRDIGFGEYARRPLVLAACQFVRQGCMGPDVSADQEELLWRLATEGHAAHLAGRFGPLQITQLGLAWKGTTNLFGWAGLAPTLAKPLRAKLSCILGLRYLRLGRPADAAGFFRAAIAEAQDDETLRRIAQDEVDRLSPATQPK